MVKLNILDYSPIDEGTDAKQALQHTTELAQRAESLGYHRFWVAEHHSVLSVASSNPEMLMMHLATSTNKIRIGSGGVMLPHYSSYKVAENFRMLEALHPNRIDLGIGRSPGYPSVNRALNETKGKRLDYEQQIQDLYHYLSNEPTPNHRFKDLTATPVTDTMPEIWTLGTSVNSAQLAAKKGMAYAFSHFINPSEVGLRAIAHYRENFEPSSSLKKPNVLLAVFAVIAETEEQAEDLAKTLDLWLLLIDSDTQPPYFPSTNTALKRGILATEQKQVKQNRKRIIIGTADQVKKKIEKQAIKYKADEITIIPNFYGAENRMNGITILAEAFGLKK